MYDGDQLNIIPIFSNEGNSAIKKNGWYRHNNIDANGSSTALFIGNEEMFAMYLLTKK